MKTINLKSSQRWAAYIWLILPLLFLSLYYEEIFFDPHASAIDRLKKGSIVLIYLIAACLHYYQNRLYITFYDDRVEYLSQVFKKKNTILYKSIEGVEIKKKSTDLKIGDEIVTVKYRNSDKEGRRLINEAFAELKEKIEANGENN